MGRVYRGIKPFSFQKDVIDEVVNSQGSGKVVVVKSRRQCGKSTLICNLCLWFSINIKGSKNYVLSPTIKQCKNIFKNIVSAISGSGIIESKNATDLIIKLKTGSEIRFKSAEQRENLRGEVCTGILCIDEAAYISSDIYNIVKPWTDFHKSVTVMFSTPFVKSGFFWDYYNYGLNQLYNCVSIDWCDAKYQVDLDYILPQSRLDEYRAILPKNTFLSEYLGEFIDDDGSVFTDFKKCVKHNEIKPTDKLFVGIDWAAGGDGDDTAISVLNQEGKQVYLDYFNKISTTHQIDRIEAFLVSHINQIALVQTELNSLGTPMSENLKERPQLRAIKDKFIGFNTSNASKNALVQNLQMAFEQGAIEILPNEKQLNELAAYTAEVNIKTRTISYNAPQGLNDDLCISLALSYDAYKNGNTIGQYTLSIEKHKFGDSHRKRSSMSVSYIGK